MVEHPAFERDFVGDAERFSEFCMCTFDEAWAVIGLCYDYSNRDEKQYWGNVGDAIRICQSHPHIVGMGGVMSQIRSVFDARKSLSLPSGDE